MNKLSLEKRTAILRCLIEGNSIRSTSRITGRSKNAIIRLLCDIGPACLEYQNLALKDLPCTRIECDEMWGFVHCKDKNNLIHNPLWGDVWLWIAFCVDTKLIINWVVGNRDAETAKVFISDLASRLLYRIQLTTDGMLKYKEAVEEAFGGDVDYTMLIKEYGLIYSEDKLKEKRYSYNACIGQDKKVIVGKPDMELASTSHIERQNLNVRMSNRRFTRLTNAFSKKLSNLKYSVALYSMFYNFVRIHRSLGITPAMAAGVTNHLWELEEVAGLIK